MEEEEEKEEEGEEEGEEEEEEGMIRLAMTPITCWGLRTALM